MKRYPFGQSEINMSKAAFERGVRACLSLPTITRASVAEAADINLGYAGKILSTLTDCNLLCEDRSVSPNVYRISPDLSIMVIDISPNAFSVSIINGDGERVFNKKAELILELSYLDLLHSLLSYVGLEIKKLPHAPSAICVIHDGKVLAKKGQKEIIDGMFASIFGMLPLLYISIGDAFAALPDFKLCPLSANERFAFIRLTYNIIALFVTEDRRVFNCNPSKLVFELDDTYGDNSSSIDAGNILSHIMTAMDFTCEIGTFIIESDYYRIDSDVIEIIRHTYARALSPLPEIYTSTLSDSYVTMAAAKLTAAELISSIIKTK